MTSTLPFAYGNIRPAGRADWPGRCEGLTRRESDVVMLIAHGMSNRDLAERLFVSENTIKSTIRSCYRKMAVETRSEAVIWAIQHGFRPDIYLPVIPEQSAG